MITPIDPDLEFIAEEEFGRIEPQKCLDRFYKENGIDRNDLPGKYNLMRRYVGVDYSLGEPSLAELEIAYLKDNGYKI